MATAVKRQKTESATSGGAGKMSAPKPVEDVAGESDFNSLTQWLMANTKDKEVCARIKGICYRASPNATSACVAKYRYTLSLHVLMLAASILGALRCTMRQLTVLMAQLALACKATSRACAKAGIANLFGMYGEQNSSGDDQKKLDVLSNDIFVNALLKSGSCCVLVSEENEEPIIVPEVRERNTRLASAPAFSLLHCRCCLTTMSKRSRRAPLCRRTPVASASPSILSMARRTSTAT